MTINKQLIQQKLDQLQNFLRQLESMDFDLTKLKSDQDIQQLVSFRLQQSTKTAIDITMHLIANLDKLKFQSKASSAFQELEKHNIISSQTARQMQLATGFRNLVVHQYADINFNQVFKDYRQDIKSLKRFSHEILDFIS